MKKLFTLLFCFFCLSWLSQAQEADEVPEILIKRYETTNVLSDLNLKEKDWKVVIIYKNQYRVITDKAIIGSFKTNLQVGKIPNYIINDEKYRLENGFDNFGSDVSITFFEGYNDFAYNLNFRSKDLDNNDSANKSILYIKKNFGVRIKAKNQLGYYVYFDKGVIINFINQAKPVKIENRIFYARAKSAVLYDSIKKEKNLLLYKYYGSRYEGRSFFQLSKPAGSEDHKRMLKQFLENYAYRETLKDSMISVYYKKEIVDNQPIEGFSIHYNLSNFSDEAFAKIVLPDKLRLINKIPFKPYSLELIYFIYEL